MRPSRILILQGHPDPEEAHLCHALADRYAEGAAQAGREVRRIETASCVFPILRSDRDFRSGTPVPAVAEIQAAIASAQHLVIVFPLWLGGMPALLKALLEQVLRPGFAFRYGDGGATTALLGGRSARLVVTMGMPSWAYRWYFRQPAVRQLRHNILGLVGIRPVRATLFGSMEAATPARRDRWLQTMTELGRSGA